MAPNIGLRFHDEEIPTFLTFKHSNQNIGFKNYFFTVAPKVGFILIPFKKDAMDFHKSIRYQIYIPTLPQQIRHLDCCGNHC